MSCHKCVHQVDTAGLNESINQDKVVEEQEVVTEKITKLSKSNSVVYIEASEVRKLKAIDENGREHDVREKAAATMEEEARRLEEKLDGDGEVVTEVKVEVINSTTMEGEEEMDKPRVKQAYFIPECPTSL